MATSSQHERDLFLSALEHDPGESRTRFLDEACTGDADLHARLDRLLQAHDATEDASFLGPAVDSHQLLVSAAASSESSANLSGVHEDYEIVRLIGRGSMGNVYEARQISLNRLVALKMIRGSALQSAADIDRFRLEAEAMASLQHPHIAPIYEVGEIDGNAFFTMKLLQGGSLSAKMDALRDDPPRFITLIVKVARALQEAHQNGIIHRDIKPGNILLDEAGEPYLTDFGLAKYTEQAFDYTMSGQIIGTPSYMAPEQALKGGRVSTLSDVYGLGAVLYRILTGEAPYRGESIMAVLEELRQGEVKLPSRIDPSIDQDLETIALKCLQRDPADRYASADHLAQELVRWLEGKPILARPLTKLQTSRRWVRRNPLLACLSLALVVLVMVLAIGGPLTAIRQSKLRSAAEASQRNEQKLRVVAEDAQRNEHQANEERHRNLYAAEMILASQLADQADGLPQITELLSRWDPAKDGEEADLRGWEWYYLKGLTERQVLITDVALHQVAFPQWIQNSDQIFVAYSGGKPVELWDCKTGEVIRRYPGHYTMGLSATPEGHIRLLTSSLDDYKINAISGEEKALRRYRTEDYDDCYSMEWDPRHRFLAILYSFQEPKLRVWDAAKGTCTPTLNDNVSKISWSADGSRLAFVTAADGDVLLWNTESQEISKLTSYHDIHSLAWHPTEPLLAIGLEKNIAICSVPDGSLQRMLRSEKDKITTLSWHPNGRWLAAGRSDHSTWIWEPSQERVLAKMAGHRGEVVNLSWKPDGAYLASGDKNGTICVWDLNQELNRYRHIEHTAAEFASWSPDGTRLAAGCISKEGLASIWDLQSGEVTNLNSVQGWGVALEWNHATDLILFGDAMNRPTQVWNPNPSPPKRLKELQYRSQSQNHYSMVSWSADGKLLALPGLKEIEIIEHPNGDRKVLKGHSNQIIGVSWNAESTLLASVCLDGSARIWSAQDGSAVQVIDGNAPLQAVTWNPAGDQLAIADHLNQIKIWKLTEQRWETNLMGHSRPVHALSWSPDGKRLASGSFDHSIRIWDMESMQLVAVMNQHTKSVLDVEWSPDGQNLVSAGEDKIIVWQGDDRQ